MNILSTKMTFFLLILTCSTYAQNLKWTKAERSYYSKAKELCNYLKANSYDSSKRDYVFSNYILFPKSLNDTSQSRLNYFDGLFYAFNRFIDSVGLDNLDAKPIRFFKNDSIFYKPFQEDLKWAEAQSLAYFDKRRPKKPLGALLFETESKKLVSWIILNMGGYLYLTPNLY